MSTENTKSISPKLVMALGILAVSTASLFIRFAQQNAPSLVVAAYRLGLASLLLTPYILLQHRSELRQLTHRQWLPMLLAGLFLAFHFGAWITSLELTSVASSVVLVTTTPLWVAIVAVVFLKEKLTRPLITGLIVAMVGGVIVGISESCAFQNGRFLCTSGIELFQSESMLGNFLAMFGAWMAAAYLVVGRKVREHVDTMVYVYGVYSIAAIFLVIACLFTRQSLWGFSPNFYLWAFLLAIVPQIIGHTTYNWALGYLPTTFVSISLLGEPIGTILLAFLFLQETPTLIESVGGVLILAGIYLASRTPVQKSQPVSSSHSV